LSFHAFSLLIILSKTKKIRNEETISPLRITGQRLRNLFDLLWQVF